ncbi:ABC transporter permease [Streptomyces sp. QH1-20]|uniref:ABC transporter permease n=1 Tax=Streptomyces sp. QH1-20 TaxID=3240934 RepID=UPI003511B5C4
MKPDTSRRAGAWRSVGLVIAREVESRMASKGYVTGILFTVIAVVGIMFSVGGGSSGGHDLAVTGAPVAAFGTAPDGYEIHQVADADTARRQTHDDTVDAAIVVRADGSTEMMVRGNTPDSVRTQALTLVRGWATQHALKEQGVDTRRLAGRVAAAEPRVVAVSGTASDSDSLGAAIIVTAVLFFQIFSAGMVVAQGVVEEKATRVVEVLLSTLTPLRLMVGKVVGIGISAIGQTAALGLAVVLAGRLGNVDAVSFPGTGAIVAALVWFVLGFFLFAFFYAAAGSLVSRPEDLQSVLMPVMMTTMLPLGVVIAAAQDLAAPWVTVIRYIPPFSGLLMPLEVSVHEVTIWQQLFAAALMLLATAVAAWVAGRVYRRSVLHVGATLRWRQALAS